VTEAGMIVGIFASADAAVAAIRQVIG